MNLRWIKAFCVAATMPMLSVVMAVMLALSVAPAAAYSQYVFNDSALQEVTLSALPAEAAETLRRIRQGGPFPYSRDGVVFGNFEKRLPRQQRGYYHEYTVPTPGVRSRGARRIVCGQSAECYYSNDHYETFRRIRE